MITPSRRGLIGGVAAFLCAPAIVRASSLMPVKVVRSTRLYFTKIQWDGGVIGYHAIRTNNIYVGDLVGSYLDGTIDRIMSGQPITARRLGYVLEA